MCWKDATMYKAGDTRPRSFKLRLGNGMTIAVTRHPYLRASQWGLRAEPFFGLHELRSTDIEAAKIEAVDLVKSRLAAALEEISQCRP